MAATVIVELTGDERRALEAYRKTEEADRKLRDATGKTGDAAQAAGRDFTDAWVSAGRGAVAGMDGLLRQLRGTGEAGRDAAAAIEGHFRETGKSGRRSMDSILESIAGLDPEAAKAAQAAAEAIKTELAQADAESAFTRTIAELKKISPEAARVAEHVRSGLAEADELTRFDQTIAELRKIDPAAAEEASKIRVTLQEAADAVNFREGLEALRGLGPVGEATARAIQEEMRAAAVASGASFDQVLASVSAIHPEAAETAERIKAEFAEAARAADFKSTLEALRKLGPAGAEMARGIQQEMDQAAAESVGSLDGIIGKIREINPAAAEVAERLRTELAAADAQTNFDRSLAELRKINPEAAKAAQAVREELSQADAEVKFDNIIEELRKLDPIAAEEAAKLRAKLKSVPEGAQGAWTQFSTSAVAQIGAMAAGYVGVSEAVGVVNNFLKEQEQLIANALQKQITLGAAQQEAAKNLAAFSAVERDELLQQAVPEIARETGFQDVGQLTLALGTAASKGATPDQARAAVAAAARVERLTPQNVDETAAGAVSVQRQSGLQDPRQAIALLQTTGTQSAITDAAKIVENLPKALGIVTTVRGQDAEEAARQAAAIFAQVTQGGNDSEGNSSATFTLDFANRLNKMFGDLEGQRVEARSQLAAIERKDAPLERDLVRAEELRGLLGELGKAQDTGTLFGRIESLQQNPAMAREFIGEGFGEKQFQVVLNELVQSGSTAAQALQASFGVIKADTAFFETQAQDQAGATPQLVVSNAIAAATAGVSAQESFDTGAATLAAVREITTQALDATNQGGMFRGIINSMDSSLIGRGGLAGSNALTEGVSAIDKLSKRRDALAVGGFTESEQQQVATIDSAIQSISTMLEKQIEGGVFDPATLARSARSTRSAATNIEDAFVQATVEGTEENQRRSREILERLAETMERQTQAVEQQTELLAATANNTRPGPPETPDFDATFQQSLEEQDGR